MKKKITLSLKNIHSLRAGSLYRFGNTNRQENGGNITPIIETQGFIFRFEGVLLGLWTFTEINGGWTVSLAPNQLIGKLISEVIRA